MKIIFQLKEKSNFPKVAGYLNEIDGQQVVVHRHKKYKYVWIVSDLDSGKRLPPLDCFAPTRGSAYFFALRSSQGVDFSKPSEYKKIANTEKISSAENQKEVREVQKRQNKGISC